MALSGFFACGFCQHILPLKRVDGKLRFWSVGVSVHLEALFIESHLSAGPLITRDWKGRSASAYECVPFKWAKNRLIGQLIAAGNLAV
jgi:hypothetical protein